MGNRAVITFKGPSKTQTGLYLHWNGGVESVLGFLDAARQLGIRGGEDRPYFWARFGQMIGNFFGGTTSLGIDHVGKLDMDNGDNGTFYIDNALNIVDRTYPGPKTVDELDAKGKEYFEGVRDQCLLMNHFIFNRDYSFNADKAAEQWTKFCEEKSLDTQAKFALMEQFLKDQNLFAGFLAHATAPKREAT